MIAYVSGRRSCSLLARMALARSIPITISKSKDVTPLFSTNSRAGDANQLLNGDSVFTVRIVVGPVCYAKASCRVTVMSQVSKSRTSLCAYRRIFSADRIVINNVRRAVICLIT